MLYNIFDMILFTLLYFFYSLPCLTQDSDSLKSDNISAYQKFFEGKKVETASGVFSLHKKDSKLYMEIADSLLNRDFLLASTVSETSDNLNSIVGSKPFNPLHLKIDKVADKIRFLNVENSNISRHPGDNIDRALSKSSLDAVFKTFDIVVYAEDSTSFIIDVTDLFCSDYEQLSPFDPDSPYSSGKVKRSTVFSSAKSYISSIKAFDDNVTVKSLLSYEVTVNNGKKTLFKDKPFSALMTRSILMLPKEAARARITDSRMSVFPSVAIVYDSQSLLSKPVYFAHRWRLEPSDTSAFISGKLTQPVKPITFYVDPDFPEEFRPAIKEGILQWNDAFERIGFKDAIVVKDFPQDDKDFDPDNLKYSCVRYAPTPIENSMGPSWVDPRSGEIISASVYIYHDVLKLLSKWLFVQTAQTDPRVRSVNIPKDILYDALRYVTAHEMGHCLGFMHNMSASAQVSVDSLRSPSYTAKYGTTTSIMDYARFNYVAQPGDWENGVKLTPPKLGRYDYYTVRWNYMPVFGVETMWDEYKITSEWIHDASYNPIYRYGKQQISATIDPRSQNEDLSDDSVRASVLGTSNLKYILNHLNEWISEQDSDYSFRNMMYEAIKEQYLQYILHVYANVGGLYLYEKLEGDPVPFYESVPSDRQIAAIDFLLEQLDGVEWIDNQELIAELGMLEKPSAFVREALIKLLVSCPEKTELSAVSSKEESPFGPQECLDRLFNHIMQPVKRISILNDGQMQTQRLFLKYLGSGAGIKIELGGTSESAFSEPTITYMVPDNRNALYYDYLMKARRLVYSASKRCRDKETKAHYELLYKKIEKALQ